MRITYLLAAVVLFGCGGSTSTAEIVAGSDATIDSSTPNTPDAGVNDEPSATPQDAALPLDGGMVPARTPMSGHRSSGRGRLHRGLGVRLRERRASRLRDPR